MARASSGGTFQAVIDGYNVVKQHPRWAGLPLRQGREQLAAGLQQVRWPFPIGRITVVFDGPETSGPGLPGRVSVVFAAPEADDAIRDLIVHHREPQRLVVISDDRALWHTAKTHGAHWHGVRWLLDRMGSGPTLKRGSTAGDKPGLAGRDIQRINEELRRRWGLEPPSA